MRQAEILKKQAKLLNEIELLANKNDENKKHKHKQA